MSGRSAAIVPCFRLVLPIALAIGACGAPKLTDTGSAPGPGPATGGGPGGMNPGRPGGGPGFTLPPAPPAAADAGAAPNAPTPPVGQSCAEEAHDGKLVPIDLLFLVDISGSMEESAGAQSKWVALRDALQIFVKDPMSAGLGAGLLFFPPLSKRCAMDGECGSRVCEQKAVCSEPANVATTEPACNQVQACPLGSTAPCTVYGLCARTGLRCTAMGQPCAGGVAGDMCAPRPRLCTDDGVASCQAASYENAVVPIAELPGNAAMLESTLNTTIPQGGTPTTPALRGALNLLATHATANPARKPVLVLATDGLPTGCLGQGNTPLQAAMALSQGRMNMPAVNTYVIGVFSRSQLIRAMPTLEQLATAGGTNDPFVLTTGSDLSQRFLQAINQIRGTALGCEFIIPPPSRGSIDFDKVNVRYNGPAGMEDLRYVASADRCDPARGGWYYDVDPAMGRPTRVHLCPATCSKVKDTAGVTVQLRFGCKTRVE